jgi:hypothetical protein
LVELTSAGKRLVDKVAAAHPANECELLAGLDANERRELSDLLRTLLLAFEREPSASPGQRDPGVLMTLLPDQA